MADEAPEGAPAPETADAMEKPATEGVHTDATITTVIDEGLQESDLDADGKQATGVVADADHENDPNTVGAAPPRPHDSLVAQLQIRLEELVDFIRPIEGELEGDLGHMLNFGRFIIAKRQS